MNEKIEFKLRKFRKSDAEALAKNINNKIIFRNTLKLPEPYTLKHANEFIKKNISEYKKKKPKDYVFAMDINGESVGAIGIHKIVQGHKAEIGYWLAEKYWGKGIMTKAVSQAEKYAFKEFNLKRLSAGVFPFNKASAKVLKNNGFKFEGRLRNIEMKNKKPIDEMMYAKIKK